MKILSRVLLLLCTTPLKSPFFIYHILLSIVFSYVSLALCTNHCTFCIWLMVLIKFFIKKKAYLYSKSRLLFSFFHNLRKCLFFLFYVFSKYRQLSTKNVLLFNFYLNCKHKWEYNIRDESKYIHWLQLCVSSNSLISFHKNLSEDY